MATADADRWVESRSARTAYEQRCSGRPPTRSPREPGVRPPSARPGRPGRGPPPSAVTGVDPHRHKVRASGHVGLDEDRGQADVDAALASDEVRRRRSAPGPAAARPPREAPPPPPGCWRRPPARPPALPAATGAAPPSRRYAPSAPPCDEPPQLWTVQSIAALLPLATGAAILRYRLYDLDRTASAARSP
jgi:hypothetical protein